MVSIDYCGDNWSKTVRHGLTILAASILVAGHTFQVNLIPSLSSFWLKKSAQVLAPDIALH